MKKKMVLIIFSIIVIICFSGCTKIEEEFGTPVEKTITFELKAGASDSVSCNGNEVILPDKYPLTPIVDVLMENNLLDLEYRSSDVGVIWYWDETNDVWDSWVDIYDYDFGFKGGEYYCIVVRNDCSLTFNWIEYEL